MIKPELYRKTVDILFKAYFDDTLEHCNTCGCAVGNLVAAGCGYEVGKRKADFLDEDTLVEWKTNQGAAWSLLFCTSEMEGQVIDKLMLANVEVMRQIDSTGYHWTDLARIEYAFETAPRGNTEEDYMFNGLVAVLETLKQIHEVDDNADDLACFEAHHLVRVTT